MSSFSPVTDRVLLLRVFVGVCPHFCAGSLGGHGGVLVLGIYIQIPCDSMSLFSDGAVRRIFPPLRPKFLPSTGDEMSGGTGGLDRPDVLASAAQIPGPGRISRCTRFGH